MTRSTPARIVGRILAVSLFAFPIVACYAHVQAGETTEECRTVEVRNKRDLEACHTKCNDEGCHTKCKERESYSREHRCWAD